MTTTSIGGEIRSDKAILADELALTPTRRDIRIIQGTDATLDFLIKDARGEPVSLVGSTVKFTAKDVENGTVKIATKTNSDPHTDNANGITTFTIAKTEIDTEVDNTERTFWAYEVRLVTAGGTETVHVRGDLIIEPEVGTP